MTEPVPDFSREHRCTDAHPHVVLQLVVEHVHGLVGGDDVDAVVRGVGDVEGGEQRGCHHGLDRGGLLAVEDAGTDDLEEHVSLNFFYKVHDKNCPFPEQLAVLASW